MGVCGGLVLVWNQHSMDTEKWLHFITAKQKAVQWFSEMLHRKAGMVAYACNPTT